MPEMSPSLFQDMCAHQGRRAELELALVALAEAALEVLARAEAAKPTADHDPDTGAERLRFLHDVGGEDDGSFFTLGGDLRDDAPHEAAGAGVDLPTTSAPLVVSQAGIVPELRMVAMVVT